MDTHSTDFLADARSGALDDLLARLNAAALAAGIEPERRLRLRLIVEELFTNTVAHGYGGDSKARIALSLAVAGGEIRLRYADSAPAFDPAQGMADSSPSGIGGHGLALVRAMGTLQYERLGDRNVIHVRL